MVVVAGLPVRPGGHTADTARAATGNEDLHAPHSVLHGTIELQRWQRWPCTDDGVAVMDLGVHPITQSTAVSRLILAAPGTYSSAQFGRRFGTVSNCPSTADGIDGQGGIYFAVVFVRRF